MIITVPLVETKLADLLGGDRFCSEIFLQADSTNVAVVNFGPNTEVDHFLVKGESAVIPVNDLNSYSIKGNDAADKLIVTVYRR